MSQKSRQQENIKHSRNMSNPISRTGGQISFDTSLIKCFVQKSKDSSSSSSHSKNENNKSSEENSKINNSVRSQSVNKSCQSNNNLSYDSNDKLEIKNINSTVQQLNLNPINVKGKPITSKIDHIIGSHLSKNEVKENVQLKMGKISAFRELQQRNQKNGEYFNPLRNRFVKPLPQIFQDFKHKDQSNKSMVDIQAGKAFKDINIAKNNEILQELTTKNFGDSQTTKNIENIYFNKNSEAKPHLLMPQKSNPSVILENQIEEDEEDNLKSNLQIKQALGSIDPTFFSSMSYIEIISSPKSDQMSESNVLKKKLFDKAKNYQNNSSSKKKQIPQYIPPYQLQTLSLQSTRQSTDITHDSDNICKSGSSHGNSGKIQFSSFGSQQQQQQQKIYQQSYDNMNYEYQFMYNTYVPEEYNPKIYAQTEPASMNNMYQQGGMQINTEVWMDGYNGQSSQGQTRIRGRKSQKIKDDNPNFDIDLDRLEEDGRTTLMIRNIPNKYNVTQLLATMDVNHKQVYDFFYLPIDHTNKCNMGYAFINFVEPKFIRGFFQEFNGRKWKHYNSEKVCLIKYARIQGQQELSVHFQNSSVMHTKDKKSKPIFMQQKMPNQQRYFQNNAIQQLVDKQQKAVQYDQDQYFPQ